MKDLGEPELLFIPPPKKNLPLPLMLNVHMLFGESTVLMDSECNYKFDIKYRFCYMAVK